MTKLSANSRTALRAALRANPEIKRFVKNLTEISTMTKAELLELAEKCSIGVQSVLDRDFNERFAQSTLQGDDQERWTYTHEHPAFVGVQEFDFAMSALGQSVTRVLRIEYRFTPEWEYYDHFKQTLHVGWESSAISAKIQGVSEGGEIERTPSGRTRTLRPRPIWHPAEVLLEDGVMSRGMYDAIYSAIEQKCVDHDIEARRSRGLAPGEYPALPRAY